MLRPLWYTSVIREKEPHSTRVPARVVHGVKQKEKKASAGIDRDVMLGWYCVLLVSLRVAMWWW